MTSPHRPFTVLTLYMEMKCQFPFQSQSKIKSVYLWWECSLVLLAGSRVRSVSITVTAAILLTLTRFLYMYRLCRIIFGTSDFFRGAFEVNSFDVWLGMWLVRARVRQIGSGGVKIMIFLGVLRRSDLNTRSGIIWIRKKFPRTFLNSSYLSSQTNVPKICSLSSLIV